MALASTGRLWRIVAGGLVAVVALALLFGTTQGREATTDFLAQFRSERQESLSLNTGQIVDARQTLSAIAHLGTVEGIDTLPDMESVESIGEASRLVGFDVLEPDAESLPDALDNAPASIRVMPAHELRFTFDLEKAHAYYQSIGQNDVNLPDRFHGTTLVVTTPPGVLFVYPQSGTASESASGIGLLIGQSGTITVDAQGGVTLEEMSDFLMDLPGLSPELSQQLRTVDEWRTTLPLPIPTDQVAWQRVTIAGSSGLLLNDNTGLGSAAIWQRDARIFAIAGAVKAEDIQRVAKTLR